MSQEIEVSTRNPTKANDLISQYGDDAKAIAMLRAAEYAASFNEAEWLIWESVILEIEKVELTPDLNG